MDYKNRIPDYRRPSRPPRKKSRAGLWASLAVVGTLVAVAIGWAVTRPKDAPPQSGSAEAAAKPGSPAVASAPNTPAKVPDKKPGKPEGKEPPKPAVEARPPVEGPVKPPEPRFTFYKILPELEAIVPESEIKNLKHEESLGNKTPAVKYQLQAGSFTNAQDAEKLKSRLSALKIKSHIETVKIENATWNRVKVGPFNTMADADRVRAYLRTNQMDSVIQKSVDKPPAAKAAGH